MVCILIILLSGCSPPVGVWSRGSSFLRGRCLARAEVVSMRWCWGEDRPSSASTRGWVRAKRSVLMDLGHGRGGGGDAAC